jgi:nitroreductase
MQTIMPNPRKTEYPVEPIFTDRRSSRAMSGHTLTREELMPLFEAARWAPSSYNNQPWRFFYALRDSAHWSGFFGLLGDFNRSWCKDAGALIVIASKKTSDRDGKPARTHSFDAGAAWVQLALQGCKNGLVVHGMEGFDYDGAKTLLGLPVEFEVEAMVAVGHPGDKKKLPAELQAREAPSPRKPLSETIFDGIYRM